MPRGRDMKSGATYHMPTKGNATDCMVKWILSIYTSIFNGEPHAIAARLATY
jgi:hypothetical protein